MATNQEDRGLTDDVRDITIALFYLAMAVVIFMVATGRLEISTGDSSAPFQHFYGALG